MQVSDKSSPSLIEKIILLVEDDPQLSKLYSKMLERTGAQIVTAISSNEAIRIIDRIRLNIIFLDLNLFQSSGFDVLSHLIKREKAEQTKLIVMSADDSALRDPLIEIADLTLIKPIQASQLLQFTHRFLI